MHPIPSRHEKEGGGLGRGDGAEVALRGIFHHEALGRVHLQELCGLQESVKGRGRIREEKKKKQTKKTNKKKKQQQQQQQEQQRQTHNKSSYSL